MSGPFLALLLTAVVHLVGMVVLIALMGRDILDVFRMNPGDDGRGGEPGDPDPVAPEPDGDGGLPLPDAAQAPVRLREPGRIAERYERRPRRPEHEPVPQPQRERL